MRFFVQFVPLPGKEAEFGEELLRNPIGGFRTREIGGGSGAAAEYPQTRPDKMS
jgi:hypothetical protein